jgi:glutaredoxin
MLIYIHSKIGCGYSKNATNLLDNLDLGYYLVSYDPSSVNYSTYKENLFSKTGMNTFPQIFIDGKLIGGFTELQKYNFNK